MSALAETTSPTRQLGVGEFHTFEASGQRFAYMVPSAAVFAMDDCSVAVVELLKTRPHAPEELLAQFLAVWSEMLNRLNPYLLRKQVPAGVAQAVVQALSLPVAP